MISSKIWSVHRRASEIKSKVGSLWRCSLLFTYFLAWNQTKNNWHECGSLASIFFSKKVVFAVVVKFSPSPLNLTSPRSVCEIHGGLNLTITVSLANPPRKYIVLFNGFAKTKIRQHDFTISHEPEVTANAFFGNKIILFSFSKKTAVKVKIMFTTCAAKSTLKVKENSCV